MTTIPKAKMGRPDFEPKTLLGLPVSLGGRKLN
jgi:hypothetical protein